MIPPVIFRQILKFLIVPIVLIILAVFVIALQYPPVPPDFNSNWPRLVTQIGIGLSVIGAAFILSGGPCCDSLQNWATVRPPTWLVLAVAWAATVVVADHILLRFPNSGDEYVFLFQAQTYLSGRIWNPLPENHDLFHFSHIFEKNGKWVGQYPPGWPIVLAAAAALNVPEWMVTPLISVALIVVTYLLTLRAGDRLAATFAMATMVLSPFVLYNGASYFSHTWSALLSVLFVLFARTALRESSLMSASLAGVSLGLLFATRSFSAVLVALPFIAVLTWKARRHFRTSITIGLSVAGGFTPPFLAYLAYVREITGDPFLPVTNWGYPLLRLGLWSRSEAGELVSPVEAIWMARERLLEGSEWTNIIILGGACLFLGWRIVRGIAEFWETIPILFVLGFLIYPSYGGNQYGPRYYFDSFPLLVATLAIGYSEWLNRARVVSDGAFPAALGVSALAAMAATIVPMGVLHHRIISERMDIYDQVTDLRLANAIVWMRSGTGVLSGMGLMDLTRNGTRLDGPVLYVAGEDAYRRLQARYPDRNWYVYERPKTQVRGMLVPFKP